MSFIAFPTWLSPDIFSIPLGGLTLTLRWYALAYIVGLLAGWKLIVWMINTPRLWSGPAPMTAEQVERLLTWVIFGVILGGRLGYVIFYQPDHFLQNPLQILRVWEGGMSFHGGFLGVAIAGIWFCKREKIPMLSLADLMAAVAPIGLLLGRLANFVNAELWGRPTNLPWGVAFPGDAAQTCAGVQTICARHPSQLYEAALEGLLLLLVLSYLIWRRGWLKTPGKIAGLFFAGYGTARLLVEFVRQPDAQFVSEGNPLGLAFHAAGYGLTMGQILTIPMIAAGIWFIAKAKPAAMQSAPAKPA
ncbi:prolipoprotein diacylglyceryl transferase [Cypionkella sp.]|uniref:prolipoprotein diacylglyceryl transferase n=1 Tax=Cypionkella sp. TaxID=2811411 RepID=UPI0027290799|nr:prolipoprotein diacylglyceryl transferase [Cypionkella sp.]MDO8985672.1 prolipoprotein diacylglyceryl transferase [Cypionkella sp.]MDP1575218.1 prolipoprotein diacylglyceryl transferase [Cypionkella sp.]MDP2049246.1 prolipoprotein diacylglyceryl transferase [Cypionkella sp.]